MVGSVSVRGCLSGKYYFEVKCLVKIATALSWDQFSYTSVLTEVRAINGQMTEATNN